MKYIDWDETKNVWLKEERDVGFDDILIAMGEGGLIERRAHPNQKKYPNQFELLVLVKDYVYVVPFVEDEDKVFFKTLFPSRLETKRYFSNSKINK